ncbi:hypothetical protein COOONC_13325 [Cooperia oncophora]
MGSPEYGIKLEGGDNVIECSALTGAQLSMKFSYNPATKNIRIPGEENIRSSYFQNEVAKFSDGVLYCSAVVTVSGWTENTEVHRTSNLIGIALNVSSFICILTANNWEWTGPGSQSSKWGKTHSMIGIFALCLAWLQPFVSAMRCNPGHPRRPYFNWAHRCIGITAMILATTAICIAADHFLSIWPHRFAQLTLSLMPLVVLIVLSAIFAPLDKLVEVNELNFEKINRIRVMLVAVGVLAMAAITITLSIFIGIGA